MEGGDDLGRVSVQHTVYIKLILKKSNRKSYMTVWMITCDCGAAVDQTSFHQLQHTKCQIMIISNRKLVFRFNTWNWILKWYCNTYTKPDYFLMNKQIFTLITFYKNCTIANRKIPLGKSMWTMPTTEFEKSHKNEGSVLKSKKMTPFEIWRNKGERGEGVYLHLRVLIRSLTGRGWRDDIFCMYMYTYFSL